MRFRNITLGAIVAGLLLVAAPATAASAASIAPAPASIGAAAPQALGSGASFAASGIRVAAARPDYCTRSPETVMGVAFWKACKNHDVCYSKKSTTDRKTCDARMRSHMHSLCNDKYGKWNPKRYACREAADVYHSFVRGWGAFYYNGKGKNN